MFSGERSDFVFCIDIFFFFAKEKMDENFSISGLFYY